MRQNRKGYMLVELVLASVLAMSIAFYLLNLTYKFKNKSEDIYQSISYISDKIAITKNIMNDLNNEIVSNIEVVSSSANHQEVHMTLLPKDGESSNVYQYRKLLILSTNLETIITYGKTGPDYGTFDEQDVSYYQKTINTTLQVGTVEVEYKEQLLTVSVPISSLYDDKRYDIKLLIVCDGVGLKFDSNGGNAWTKETCSNEFILNDNSCSKLVHKGLNCGSMPIPTRRGYHFLGWYDDVTFGNKVEETTTIESNEDRVLYAHWKKNYLFDQEVGSYVSYIGNNGCSTCNSKNITYCGSSDQYEAKHTGWRIGYKKGNIVHLISANGVECANKPALETKLTTTLVGSQKVESYFGSGYTFDESTGLYTLTGLTDQKYLIGEDNYMRLINNYPYACKDSFIGDGSSVTSCEQIIKIGYHSSVDYSLADHQIYWTEEYYNHEMTKAQLPTINRFNAIALKYCNKDYAYNGTCSIETAWTMNANDFHEITGNYLYNRPDGSGSCFQNSNNCLDRLDLIDSGNDYWIATANESNIDIPVTGSQPNTVLTNDIYWWDAGKKYVSSYRTNPQTIITHFSGLQNSNENKQAVRPIIKLNQEVYVVGGTGTESDPYQIDID